MCGATPWTTAVVATAMRKVLILQVWGTQVLSNDLRMQLPCLFAMASFLVEAIFLIWQRSLVTAISLSLGHSVDCLSWKCLCRASPRGPNGGIAQHVGDTNGGIPHHI